VTREVAGEDDRAGSVEGEGRRAGLMGSDRQLARDRRVKRLGGGGVAPVYSVVADDQLMSDGIGVADLEAHGGARPHLEAVEAEPAVLDAQLDGDLARPEHVPPGCAPPASRA